MTEGQTVPSAVITGPFEVKGKADIPRFCVIVKREGFVNHRYFDGRDNSTSGRAEGLKAAEAFAEAERKVAA